MGADRALPPRPALRRLAALLALAVGLALVAPTITLPRYQAASLVWLRDPSMVRFPVDRAPGVVAATITPENIGTAFQQQALGLDPAPVRAPALGWTLDNEGLLRITFVDDDPVRARQVVDALGAMVVDHHPGSSFIPSWEVTHADIPDPRPAQGWGLVGGLVLLCAGALLLLGLVDLAPRRGPGLAFVSGIAAIALAALLPSPGGALGLVLGWGLLAAALGWRLLLVASLAASSTQGGAFDPLLSGRWWLVAQLLPLLLAGLALRPWQVPLRRASRGWRVVALAWAALAVWAGITAPWSMFPRRSLLHACVLLVFGGFLLLVWLKRWDEPSRLRRDVGTVAVTVSVSTLVAGAVLAGGLARWPLSPVSGRFQGYWFNPNALGLVAGAACVAAVSFALHRLARAGRSVSRALVWVVLAAVLGAATLATASRGAIGGVALGVLVAVGLLLGRRHLVKAAAGMVGVLVVFALVTAPLGLFRRAGALFADSGRSELWADAWRRFLSSPLIGVGFRTGNADGPTYTFHNIYLSMLAELGIVGLLLFGCILAGIVVAGRRARPTLLGVVVMVAFAELYDSSLVGFLGPVALPVWLLLLAHAAVGDAAPRASGAAVEEASQ